MHVFRYLVCFGGCAALLIVLGCGSDPEEAPCPSGQERAGQCVRTCQTDNDCLLSQRCEVPFCVGLEGSRPVILEFSGPDRVGIDQSAQLVFRSAFGTARRLLSSDGSTQLLAVDSGTVTVGPLMQRTTFDLEVENPEGVATAQLVVDVMPVAPVVAITQFQASPDRFGEDGGEVRLIWRVENTTADIEIFANSQSIFSSSELSGELLWPITETTDFELVAPGFPVPARQTVRVGVDLDPPTITAFEALVEPPLLRDQGVLLRWTIEGASQVRLEQDNQTLVVFTTTTSEARGAWLVAPNQQSTTGTMYRLSAFASLTSSTSQMLSLSPVHLPTIDSFTLSPEFIGSGEATVSAAWRVSPPSSLVFLQRAGELQELRQPSGRQDYDHEDRGGIRLHLEAENPAGTVVERRVTYRFESGSSNLNSLDTRPIAVRGSVRNMNGIDEFVIQPPIDGQLRAFCLDTCRDGLAIDLFNSLGAVVSSTVVGQNFTPEVSIQPTADTYTVQVAAGSPGQAFEYEIAFDVQQPACGDGVITTQLLEACDDGNLVNGDGCNDQCQVEPGWSYSTRLQPLADIALPVGTPIELVPYVSGGDGAELGRAAVDIGSWSFPFFGASYRGFEVHTRGYITFYPDVSEGRTLVEVAQGPGAPNAFIAPFLRDDLRLASDGQITVEPISGPGGSRAIEIAFDGLESLALEGSRLVAIVRLDEFGGIQIRYPAGVSDLGGLQGRAVVESPRGLERFTPSICEPSCAVSALEGQELIFEFPIAE